MRDCVFAKQACIKNAVLAVAGANLQNGFIDAFLAFVAGKIRKQIGLQRRVGAH